MTDTQDDAGSNFSATPIPEAPFGVEAKADLLAAFSPAEKDALAALYRRDGLLLIRNQQLTLEQQLDACSIFGPVLRGALDNYIVSNVQSDGLLGNRELLFHHDIPYVPAPYLGGSLLAIQVDAGVSPTRFVSGFNAYDRLPEKLRNRIDGLNALHVRERAVGRRTRLTDLIPTDNCAVHALVGRQQVTNRPFLFVDLDMTACIIGMSEAESDELLEELFSYLYAEGQVYDHVWQAGDIVIWDNLVIQHARKEVGTGTRTLRRVTIAEHGYWDQYPVDMKVLAELQSIKPQKAEMAN